MSKTCDHGNVIDLPNGINCVHCLAEAIPKPDGTHRAHFWPFVETPGQFAERLAKYSGGPGGLLAGVRTALIEEPPTLSDEYLRRAGAQHLF